MMHGFGFGYGYGGPMSWLFGLLGLIMNLSFVIIAVLAAIWLFRSVFKKEDTPELSHTSALEILKERYAKGELNSEEFAKMKEEISDSTPVKKE
jgi:putative membrane protein